MPATAHNLRVHTVTTRDKGNGVTEAFVQLRYDLACGHDDDPMLLSIKGADAFVKKTNLVMTDKEATRKLENERDGAMVKCKELQERVNELSREQQPAIVAAIVESDNDEDKDETISTEVAIAIPIEQLKLQTDALPQARSIKKKKTNKGGAWCIIS